jgi:hypothetical protein
VENAVSYTDCRITGARGLLAAVVLALLAGRVPASDTGALGNGDWSSAATWTNGVPGANDNAYIGSSYPTGAASTAIVNLSQNATAANVSLGTANSGTLDLKGFTLATGTLNLGGGDGTAWSIARTGGGTLSVSDTVNQFGGSFSMASGDVLANIYMFGNSTATTSAVGNVTQSVWVDPTSTLTLGADLSLGNYLYLNGTLNAAGHSISAPIIGLGYGGPFAISNRGAITTDSLTVSSTYSPSQTTFNLSSADAVTTFTLVGVNTSFSNTATVQNLKLTYDGSAATPTYSTATTSAVGNVTANVGVGVGCTLTLGADLNLSDSLDLQGTLNAGGHAISANQVYLGYNGGPYVLNNRGPIIANYLAVSSKYSPGQTTFSPTSADAITFLTSYGVNVIFPNNAGVQYLSLNSNGNATPTYATGTTSAVGNITSVASVGPGCTLTLGADLSVDRLDLGGTLNANGHAVTAGNMALGYYTGGMFTLVNRGPITAANLDVSSQYSQSPVSFNLTAADAVSTLILHGVNTSFAGNVVVQNLWLKSNDLATPAFSTATTSSAGNITQTVYIDPGCTLTQGTDINVGSLYLYGTLNANGHKLSGNNVTFGGLGPYTINNRGPISVGILEVSSRGSPGQTTFTLTAADTITAWFELYGVNTTLPSTAAFQSLYLRSNGEASPLYATATTSTVTNVKSLAYVEPGCTLTLGANLSLSNWLDLRGNLAAGGHSVTATTIYMGYNAGPATLQNDGLLFATTYQQGNSTGIQLHQPGDTFGTMDLTGNSSLLMHDAAGQSTGLILSNSASSSLVIDPGSVLTLEINGQASGWILRWADPSPSNNHIADLQTLINGGEITFSFLNGGAYTLTADSQYTYVSLASVPEPSALMLTAAVGGLVTLLRVRWGLRRKAASG